MTRVRPPMKSQLPPHARSRPSPARAPDSKATPEAVRLQKYMASAGVGSRRHCEELITSGRVEIDGRTALELGTKVLPGQHVSVDGTPLAPSRPIYFLVYKPTGVVSTNYDPSGRPRVVDLLPPTHERLFTVGRLDMSSEGLMLVTNDGELANRLAHPRYGVEKTYQVLVAGVPDLELTATLRRGVHLAEGMARATSVRVKKTFKQSTLMEIVLSEGKNREIRRVLAKLGHKVLKLKRIALGTLRLGEMAPGEFRRLTTDELRALRGQRAGRSSGGKPAHRPGKPRTSRPSRPPATAATARPRAEKQAQGAPPRRVTAKGSKGLGTMVRRKHKGRRD